MGRQKFSHPTVPEEAGPVTRRKAALWLGYNMHASQEGPGVQMYIQMGGGGMARRH